MPHPGNIIGSRGEVLRMFGVIKDGRAASLMGASNVRQAQQVLDSLAPQSSGLIAYYYRLK